MSNTGKEIKSKLPYFTRKNIYSDTLIKNCGFSPYFFDKINNFSYIFEKNQLKKMNSSNETISILNDDNSKHKENIIENEDKENNKKQIKYNIGTINNINKVNNKTNDDSNYYDPKIHFDYLINNINDENSETSKIIEAYKSKRKRKFINIYENNSINFNEKNKYRLFHKCRYPGCNRTFSSSGWLKAHYKKHLKQIQNSLFCKLFRTIILNDQIKLMNNLNNNFLGLKNKINDNHILKLIHEKFNSQSSLVSNYNKKKFDN